MAGGYQGFHDSDFNQRHKYLEEQRLFHEKDKLLVERQETIIRFLTFAIRAIMLRCSMAE